MKVLVSYHSETGNTEKVANAIYDSIEQSEKEISLAVDVSDVSDYNLIFCGFPVQSMSLPKKMESFINSLPAGKKVAFFATHGSLRGGALAVTAFYHAISLAKNLKVIGTFGCRGTVKQGIIDSLLKKAEHRGWALEAQSAAGHPDEADLEDAKSFAEAMMIKARAE